MRALGSRLTRRERGVLPRRGATSRAIMPVCASINSLAVTWYTRSCLRVTDHEPLLSAVQRGADAHLPVFVLDTRELLPRRQRPDGLGVPKLGPHRLRFMLEGLSSLHRDLAALHSIQQGTNEIHPHQDQQQQQEQQQQALSTSVDAGAGPSAGGLVVRVGKPEEELPRLLECVAEHSGQLREVSVHHHLLPGADCVEVERRVSEALGTWARRRGVSLTVHTYWDRTLYHPDDLPYHAYGGGTDRAARRRRGGGGGGAWPGEGEEAGPAPAGPPINADPDRFRSIPPVMTTFRKATQGACSVRAPLPAPAALPPLPPPFAPTSTTTTTSTSSLWPEQPLTVTGLYDTAGATCALQRLQELVGLDYHTLLSPLEPHPNPQALWHPDAQPHPGEHVQGSTGAAAYPDPRSAFPFRAGEREAARRLRQYVWGHPDGEEARGRAAPPSLLYFTNTRAQAVGVDSSTKLSPFVALGCTTPRLIHAEVEAVRRRAEEHRQRQGEGQGQGGGAAAEDDVPAPAECDWLDMHLCIRDFFIVTALKAGDSVMRSGGLQGQEVAWRHDEEAFRRWCRGSTGLPFVDANMRELAATGWMSNRGRQNVASFLTKDLGIDWRWGAELFECLLLDADEAVNYVNWNYFAGVGNDPRNRQFKTVTQGIKYDEDAVLAATWLPELTALPPALRHQPWAMTPEEEQSYGVALGRDYPHAMVDWQAHVGQLVHEGKGKGAGKGKGKGKGAGSADGSGEAKEEQGKGGRRRRGSRGA